MTTLLGAFTFAPVVYRQSRGPVVTFHAEIPDVQLERLPAAVEALRALDDVTSIAVVSIPPDEVAPAPPAPVELAGGDGGSVRRRS